MGSTETSWNVIVIVHTGISINKIMYKNKEAKEGRMFAIICKYRHSYFFKFLH